MSETYQTCSGESIEQTTKRINAQRSTLKIITVKLKNKKNMKAVTRETGLT